MQALEKLQECGLIVMAVICDCLAANVSIAKLLGCRVHEQCYDDLMTTFQCPGHSRDIHVIFDACHGLKLLRNILGDMGTLISSTYGVIQCKHIEVLHQLQEKESLNAANKLSRAHVEYHRQIMKVKLAAQTFSASVRKALEFASELSLPGFEGAFDLLNSSSPIAKGFKVPLRPSTFHYQKEAMEQAGRELMALQLVTGKPLVQDSRRMSVISLVFTLKSVSHLAQVIFEADLCRYICTRRLNQDPIEMYFSCIRQRGGWNNNPSAAQFRQAYRRTLVHAQAASSRNANVLPQVQGICLPRSQGSITCTQAETTDCEESMSANTLSLLEHDYADISVFSSQVVCYIAGFIVRRVVRHLHCDDCAELLVSDTKGTLLLTLKDNGRLIEASAFVQAALRATERLVRQGTTTGHAKVEKLALTSFQTFVSRHVTMLNNMNHYREEPQHVLDLTKVIQRKYVVLRFRALARRITVSNRGSYVRHTLTKRVLFAHQ
ncbi:hypothetical protein MRX96_015844 [Rhipicephalus microplus]